jgi:hypothetical protein
MQSTISDFNAQNFIPNPTDGEELPLDISKQPAPQSQQQAFTAVHSAANTAHYPNSNQADKEKVQNNAQQARMQDVSNSNDLIKQQREPLQARKNPGIASVKEFTDEIRKIKQSFPESNGQLGKSSSPNKLPKSHTEKANETESQEKLEKDSALKKLANDIHDCKASIKSATEKNQEKELERLQKNLQDLKQQQANLQQELSSDRNTDSDSSVGPPSENSESEDSQFLADANSPPMDEEELRPFHETLCKWEDELKKNKTELVIKTRAKANKEEIAQYQQEINALQTDIEKLKQILRIAEIDSESTPDTPDAEVDLITQSPTQAEKSSVADVIRRTKTGRRNYATSENKVQSTTLSNSTPTPLKQLHGSSTRRSALLSRDDLKPLFTTEAQRTLQKIDEKIEAVAGAIDELFVQKNNIKNIVKNKKSNEDQSQEAKELRKIDLRIKKLVIELTRLNNRLTIVENWVLPGTEQLSDKQKHERYEAFLQKYKSDNTLKLEEDYKKKRAEYERKILGSSSKNAMSLLSGGVANFATFFWGNSLTRLLASKLPDAASYIASYIGGAVAGLLHATVGGPVLKQVASASWNAPALTKFNDYWKVLGSLWGDRLRARLGKLGVERWVGENHKEKYLSTDPKHKGLVDIEQRWKETPGLLKLFWDRYKTEEAAYYSYAMNFTFKAGVAAGLYRLMATKSDDSKVIEWVVHSVMGWFSGAETVAGVQLARSKVSGATESAIPNREIHAAHAAMLESLLKNLEDAYEKLRTQTPSAAGDSEQRDLLKAIRRTQKTLNEAKTKSSVGGTFWFEFLAQFKTVDARADAAAEVLGRALSVMPSAALSNFLASWRTSGNPVLTFAGHALPALLLIAPPGWTMRPIYAGFFRALFQIVINETSPKTNTSGHASTTTAVPDDLHDSIVDGDDSSEDVGSQFSELDKVEESVVVAISEGDQVSDDDDSDDERWRGKATARNQQNYW